MKTQVQKEKRKMYMYLYTGTSNDKCGLMYFNIFRIISHKLGRIMKLIPRKQDKLGRIMKLISQKPLLIKHGHI